MAGPDDGESAVEVALDGADGQAGGSGDLGEVEFLDEAKKENGALALGELGDGIPDEGQLLFGCEAVFGRAVVVGDVLGYVGDVDCSGRDAFPEAKALGAGVVAKKIEGDAHEPGGDGTVFAERGTVAPGAKKSLLGEGLGDVAVAGGGEEEAEDALLVEGYDGAQVVEGRCGGLVCCGEDVRDGLGWHGCGYRVSVAGFHLLSGQTWGVSGKTTGLGIFSHGKRYAADDAYRKSYLSGNV